MAKSEMASNNGDSLLTHWKCMLACGVMILFPFQYGIDFGLIGGLQAMIPFLKVHMINAYMYLPISFEFCYPRQQLTIL
jgi:TRAP-type C4-dicarboxylate transport system permease small subunit